MSTVHSTARIGENEIQELLAAVVESSDDAIMSMSVDNIIITWNKGAEELYGYKPEEIIGRPTSVLMPPEKKDDFPYIMERLQEGKKIEHYETKRKTKDGRIVDVSITLSPIRDATGRIIGASKVARNITDRKRFEERQKFLQQASSVLGSSIDYEATLKNLGKLIVPFLSDYCRIVVLDANKEIKEITINHADRKKLHLVRELYDAYKNEQTSGVGQIIRTGKSEIMSTISPDIMKQANLKTQDLVSKLHLTSYIGVPMKIGRRVVGAITFSSTRDERLYTKEDLFLAEELARRAALAIENARLYAESQKAVALRDEFISVASHELKTPLTSLKMYLQVLKKQAESKGEDTSHIGKMDAQINKLTVLVQDLLNVAKFQSGKFEYHDETFDLDALVSEVVETIQPTSQKHSLQVEGSVGRSVWGDKDRIGQVLTNLLTNAIKYSPHADTVIVQLKPEKKEAIVCVKDFGIGIDKKHLGKLFERFYRVADPKEKTFPGLGLGLYISHEIIKRYGGKMRVTSQKEKGSEFSFSIPYEQITQRSASEN